MRGAVVMEVSMRRSLLALIAVLVVAALAGGYLHFRQQPQAGVRAAVARPEANAVSAVDRAGAPGAGGVSDPGRDAVSSATSEGARQAPAGGASTALGAASLSPISEANMKRVRAMQADLGQGESLFRDLQALHDMEGRDEEWSSRVEAYLDTHVRSKAVAYGGLEVSAPNCSRTLCYMSAVVKPGVSPTAANADWQTLVTSAYGEPWFRDSFSDAHTVLGGDANGTIYLSVFIRK
jgi:hypothetical protein